MRVHDHLEGKFEQGGFPGIVDALNHGQGGVLQDGPKVGRSEELSGEFLLLHPDSVSRVCEQMQDGSCIVSVRI